jgi:YidC/Oxa1 family membrane protein insertase
MDRTSLIVVIICVIVLITWTKLVNKIYPPKPLPPGVTNVQTAPLTSTNAAAVGPASGTAFAQVPLANTNIPEETEILATPEARYTFTSHGGGIKLIELQVKIESRDSIEIVPLNRGTPAPTLAVLGGEPVQGDGIFKLTKTDHGLRAEKTLTNGLVLVREFEPTNNYLLSATVRMENRSGTNVALPLQEWIVGTATPLDARDNGQNVGVIWYNGSKTEDVGGSSYFSKSGFMCLPRTPPLEWRGGSNNVAWVATHNQYFALALLPQQPGESLLIRRIDLPRFTGEEATRIGGTNAPPPQGYKASIIYPSITLTNGQVVEQKVWVYAGPKEYETLNRAAERMGNNFDQIMSFGLWGFVSKALLFGMNWMHRVLRIPYGWTIVGITVLIKLVFWPLTASSTRSAKRMQALAPQVKALQEKYKDDPMKAQKKVMEFYKENKVNPMGSCLPMLLQIPVFFGFLMMIRTAIELRGVHWLWVTDLSKPDTLFWIPNPGGVIPFIGAGIPFNLLPLIMGATMLWQAHLTPPSPGMDKSQQAIMKYLPLIFLVTLYNFSAAMTLYWTTNNLLTIVQTKLTKNITAPTNAPTKPAPPTPPQKKQKNIRR